MKYLAVVALCMLWFVAPAISYAQLVPVQCSGAAAAVECGTCEFVDLINNVIQFVITLSTILATIVIIYAGFRLVTSAGDVSAKEVAKRVITNVLIGYVLILAAFLIVNTILGILVGSDEMDILSWQEIECIRPVAPTLEVVEDPDIRAFDIFEEDDGWSRGVYTENDVPSTRCSTVDSCAAAVTTCESRGLVANYNNQIPGVVECNLPAGTTGGGNYTGPLAQCAPGNTSCSVAALQAAGFTASQANVMSCIAMTESSGNASIGPYNERHPESNSSACGLFQVTRTTWNANNPGGSCSDWRSSCQNAACNRQAALNLVRARNYSDWTCPNCNNRAASCVARYE